MFFLENDPPPPPPPGWALSKKHLISNLFPLASSIFYAAAVPVNNWLKPLWLADDDFAGSARSVCVMDFFQSSKQRQKQRQILMDQQSTSASWIPLKPFPRPASAKPLQQWEWQIAKPCDNRNKRHSPPALASDMITFWLHCRYILVILRCILVKKDALWCCHVSGLNMFCTGISFNIINFGDLTIGIGHQLKLVRDQCMRWFYWKTF